LADYPALQFRMVIDAESATQAMAEARRVLDALPMVRPCTIEVAPTWDFNDQWFADVDVPASRAN
jgi:hypothetical protein